MALAIGTHLGSHEITGLLGKGGMGEVYRARDFKLKREVAIKILPEEFARDTDRATRFQREAEVLASLNHPNIAAIYDLEETNGTRCLVLELVEGETLARRIARGPIAVEDAIDIAKQICAALEAAHERGIIHRDLKPANVKITSEGKVKVLDFGLAKAFEINSGAASLSDSPTLSAVATNAGVILGTAAYMSPEQAKGRTADTRSDIWSFGVVFFEMLAGKSLFDGESTVEVLGGIMKADPDWSLLPGDTPPAVRSLLRRCLQKDRSRRYHSAADVRLDLEDALTQSAPATAGASGRKRPWVWWAAATLVLAGAASYASIYFRPLPPKPPEMRLQITTPPANNLPLAVSPDGRKIAFSATTEGKSQLWIRFLDQETAQPVKGTDDGVLPFWSADSRSIGFFGGGKLKRIDIEGGTAQVLADANGNYGGTWNADDIILFAPSNSSPLYRVPASGGSVEQVTSIQSPQQAAHRWPSFLPDNRHFLFFVTGTPEVAGVYIGALDSKDTRRLFNADTPAMFRSPNYLLFVRQDTLFAQHFRIQEASVVGEPVPVAQHVAVNYGVAGNSGFSSPADGPVAYRSTEEATRQLVWLDRSGKQIGALTPPENGLFTSLQLSPDDKTAAIVRTVDGNGDIWLVDTTRGTLRRFTSNPAFDTNPHWSPDGTRIMFESFRIKTGIYNFFEKTIDGSENERLLLESPENKNNDDWSPDNKFILYEIQNPKTARDLWALPLQGERKPFVVLQTEFVERGGRFSPDGHWIAFESLETGRNEIYVQPFPGPGRKWRISTDGGGNPQWRNDGHEIFYMGLDNRLMAAPLKLSVSGQTVEVGTPTALFTTRPGSTVAASRDGQRFLVNTAVGESSSTSITVILNWTGAEKRSR